MATSAMEVLMGVHRFGVKVSDQMAPVTCYFGVKERDGLPGPLGGKFDGTVICIVIIYEFYQEVR